MSQSAKRDAEEAFDKTENHDRHQSKRMRKERKERKFEEQKGKSKHLTSSQNGKTKPLSVEKALSVENERLEPLLFRSSAQESANAVHDEQAQVLEQNSDSVDLLKVEKSSNRKRRKHMVPVLDNPHRGTSEWQISTIAGGIFIAQDPLLLADGHHLVLATQSEVHIYSNPTSLLVRKLPLGQNANITSYFQSLSDPAQLFVATYDGTISVFDWSTGIEKNQWETRKGLKHIRPLKTDAQKQTILCLYETSGRHCDLLSYNIDVSSEDITSEGILLTKSKIFPDLRVLQNGAVIVAYTTSQVCVGLAQPADSSVPEDPVYVWRDFAVPEKICSLDAQLSHDKSKSKRKMPPVDLVIGFTEGFILIYEDILFKLVGREKNALKENIVGKKLHWHRNAVNTVKWSRDGNYIISGGSETVLVIWQLDTNQKQFLPHLSTAILNLTVSASGSAYAIRMGDNSVMILSTADLMPSTNITGLAFGQSQINVPAVIHPKDPDILLAAVPAHAISSGKLKNSSAVFLQSYNLSAHFQSGRQALTRNMTTAVNIGPKGATIREPNITHVQITQDGKWLATIDTWTPESKSLDESYLRTGDDYARRTLTETHLRIWTWNEAQKSWELVTRIDEPHEKSSQPILNLTAHPTRLEFSSIGSDRTVRIWTPKARKRDGVSIRDASGRQLYTWTCSQSVHCSSGTHRKPAPHHASAGLSYSEDGSVLAAAWSSDPAFVHLIDRAKGTVFLSLPGLVNGRDPNLSFNGRFLICLSNTLVVFDTITLQQTYNLAIDQKFLGLKKDHAASFLAVNHLDKTFAVALNRVEPANASTVAVFDITNLDDGPVSTKQISSRVKALLTPPSSTGFIPIDDRSRVLKLTPPGSRGLGTSALTRTEPEELRKGLDAIFGPRVPNQVQMEDRTIEDKAGKGRSREDLLTAPSTALAPSIKDLFEKVVDLYVKMNEDI